MLIGKFSRLGQFLRWWRNELVGLTPWKTVRMSSNEPAFEVELRRGGQEFFLSNSEGGNSYPSTREGYNRLLADLREAGFQNTKNSVKFRLDHDVVHFVEEQYPASSQSRLGQFLKLKIDQDMPFDETDVYADSAVNMQGNGGAKITVLHGFVKRPIIDSFLGMTDGFKTNVSEIYSLKNNICLNFLPDKYGQKRKRAQLMKEGSAYLALLMSAMFLLISIHSRLDRQIDLLSAQLLTERKLAGEVRDDITRVNRMIAALNGVRERKDIGLSMAGLIEKIEKTIPEDTRLTNLRVSQGTVELTGLSPAAANLLETFDLENGVSDVEFLAPVTLDRREDKERFSLSFIYNELESSAQKSSLEKSVQRRNK